MTPHARSYQAGNLNTERERARLSYGLANLDSFMSLLMATWDEWYGACSAQLQDMFREAEAMRGTSDISVYEYKDLTGGGGSVGDDLTGGGVWMGVCVVGGGLRRLCL